MQPDSKSTFRMLFILKKSRSLKNGQYPIALRVTVKGEVAEISTQRSILPKLWNQDKETCRGSDHESKTLNTYLTMVKNKVLEIHGEMVANNSVITAAAIKDRYMRKDDPANAEKMLCEIYAEHNKKCWALVGIDYSKSTAEKFDTSLKCLREFMQFQYHVDDLPLSEIKGEFVRNLEFFLKTEKRCQHNSAIKHLKNLKKVIRIALANEWMSKDPFRDFPFKVEKVDKEALTIDELEMILAKVFPVKRVEQVRDIFVFCCFTSLAFADVSELTHEHIEEDSGHRFIRKKRHKTEQECVIPLIGITETLIDKYINNEKSQKKGTIFPVLCNQRMNAYLKEIADICGININLTTHVARHTYASIGLDLGIPLEVIQKNMGHASIKTTQIYAKVRNSLLVRESSKFEERFAHIKAE